MKFPRQHIATFLALLFHGSALIGILLTPYREWFIRNTPLNLLLMAVLLAWNQRGRLGAFAIFFVVAFVVGVISEMIGVNTGQLFGSYSYGDILGPRWNGVPLIIGINWFVIVYCSGTIMNQVHFWMQSRLPEGAELSARISFFSLVVDGALLAVAFDWLMEPVAMKLGFWTWADDTVPVFNYACWLLLSMVLLAIFRWLSFGRSNFFAVHLFIIELLFFLVLRIYL